MSLIPSSTKLTGLSGLNTKISAINSTSSLNELLKRNQASHSITIYKAAGGMSTYNLPPAKGDTKIPLGVLVCDFLCTMIDGSPAPARIFGLTTAQLKNLPNDANYKQNCNLANHQGKRYITYDVAILDTTLNPLKDANDEPIGSRLEDVVISGLSSTTNYMIDVVANFDLLVDPYTIKSIHMVPVNTTQAR